MWRLFKLLQNAVELTRGRRQIKTQLIQTRRQCAGATGCRIAQRGLELVARRLQAPDQDASLGKEGAQRRASDGVARLGEQLDGGKQSVRSRRIDGRPVAGTRLIRNWEGSDCEVLVGLDYFEYAGQRYKSLSSIARTITGTNRNGWTFFGFSSGRGL